MGDLHRMFLQTKTTSDVEDVLKWGLGEKELYNLKLRVEITKMLIKGYSYAEIQRQTGASSATVAKVSKNISTKVVKKYFLKGKKV